MLATATRAGKKRRLYEASIDYATFSITTSIQRTQLFRKWHEAFKCANYTPAFTASTTADESVIGTTPGEWVWRPSPHTAFQPAPPASDTTPSQGPTPHTPQKVGLWLPFLGNRLNSNGIDSGRRFFARISAPKPLAHPKDQHQDPLIHESWRPSQSEDTYDLDENVVELLTMDASRLPKPCDPLTYRFWKHGMRREFEPMPDASFSSSTRNASTFSVCTYNVLCQRTLGYYIEQLYSHCPFEHLTWPRRWPLLAVELQMLDADVFCLQEVQHDHFEQDFMPLLSKLGYDGTFKKKLRKKSDGCATFWRRDKFRPVLVQPVEYTLPAPHDHSDSVALITVLEPVSNTEPGSEARVVVANTHLIYQPALGATKLCQAALLLAHLQKVTRQYTAPDSQTPAPLILCGDFNSTPFSPLYSLLVKGQLQYEGLTGWSVSGQPTQPSQYRRLNSIGDTPLGAPLLPDGSPCSELCTLVDSDCEETTDHRKSGSLSHSLNLRSVYDHVTKDGEPEVTMFLRDQPAAVDYIFYSVEDKEIHESAPDDSETSPPWSTANVRENGLRCLERYRLPGSSHLKRAGYLPNQYCASDHLPLMAKFALDR